MKNLILVLSIIFLSYGNSAYTHVIDDVEAKCIANTSDTQEMNKCSKIAQVSWEKEIKKSIIQLKKRMDNTSYKSLMKSQRAWQEYKNQEFSSRVDFSLPNILNWLTKVNPTFEFNIRTKSVNGQTFLLQKPDISDILSQLTSDLNKLAKAGLLRAFALAMT